MNCYKFNAFFDKLYPLPQINYLTQKVVYFHCIADGHYWRTSHIHELSLLFQNENNEWVVQSWKTEKEEDEYDLLKGFIDTILPYDTLVGFNSTSFHLPFLESKLKSYDLPLIILHKNHIDLLKLIKPIGKHLHISTKLQDLRIFFNINERISEIESIAYYSYLFVYEEILNGSFDVLYTEKVNDVEFLITCNTCLLFPNNIRINDEEFYLIGENNSLKVLLKSKEGYVRLYYPNYKDYYYLPEENMILHKSLASTLPKSQKVKATKANCYTLIHFEEKLKDNPQFLRQYLISLFHHYKEK